MCTSDAERVLEILPRRVAARRRKTADAHPIQQARTTYCSARCGGSCHVNVGSVGVVVERQVVTRVKQDIKSDGAASLPLDREVHLRIYVRSTAQEVGEVFPSVGGREARDASRTRICPIAEERRPRPDADK